MPMYKSKRKTPNGKNSTNEFESERKTPNGKNSIDEFKS